MLFSEIRIAGTHHLIFFTLDIDHWLANIFPEWQHFFELFFVMQFFPVCRTMMRKYNSADKRMPDNRSDPKDFFFAGCQWWTIQDQSIGHIRVIHHHSARDGRSIGIAKDRKSVV